MAGASQLGWTQQCVAVDEAGTCTSFAAMPPHYALPPFSAGEAAIVVAFVGTAWFVGHLVRTARRAVEEG